MNIPDDIRRPDLEQYVPGSDVGYVEIENELHHIEAHLMSGGNLLQRGPPGIGKTLSFNYIAAKHDIPLVQFGCSKDASKADLIIRPWIDTVNGQKRTVYVPGALPMGVMAANEYGMAILVLDEINSLTPQLQKQLNELTDYRGTVSTPEAGYTFQLEDDAKLLIGATMNPAGVTGGVFDINSDLRSRFSELNRVFPTGDMLREILKANDVPNRIGSTSDVHQQLSALINSAHSMGRNGQVDYVFTPRDGVRVGKQWHNYYDYLTRVGEEGSNPERKSLRETLRVTVLDKYDNDEDREQIEDVVQRSFTLDV